MSNNVTVAFYGNLASDPELRFTASGAAACKFTVAQNERRLNKDTQQWEDGNVSFYQCTAWRQLGEHVAESLHKGDRVLVIGTLRQRNYDKEGEKRYVWEVTVDAVGPDLAYAIATVKKLSRGANRDDPWATDPGMSADRPELADATAPF